ncbi:hypothetical protein [Pseudaminobacter sp. NGMCC 1.201702]|uniref:hypothetical protein n=1 Tax=Pseudaminobacter sp. NGMCC 1.201702 TaxID=3391825 RepID=UPI0039F0EB85
MYKSSRPPKTLFLPERLSKSQLETAACLLTLAGRLVPSVKKDKLHSLACMLRMAAESITEQEAIELEASEPILDGTGSPAPDAEIEERPRIHSGYMH